MSLWLRYDDSKTNETADAALWGRLKDGDENALSSIYSTYFSKLYNYGIRIIVDQEQLKDSIQDLFIEIWNGRQNLGDVSHIKSYLFKSLRRKILRLKSRPLQYCKLESFPLELSHKSHYVNHQIDREIRQQLATVVSRLTAQQKEAIFLIYYEELSYKEVAENMGLKIRTVYNLIYEALLQLRQHKRDITLLSFPLFF